MIIKNEKKKKKLQKYNIIGVPILDQSAKLL